jgi:hypothetical protein
MNWFGLFRKSGPAGKSGPRQGPPSLPPSAPLVESSTPPAAEPVGPEELRRVLFDAVASGDEHRLERLCEEHREVILSHASNWLEIPPAFRASPEIYEWYGNGLKAIAQFCAERLQRPDLLDHLPSPASSAEPVSH